RNHVVAKTVLDLDRRVACHTDARYQHYDDRGTDDLQDRADRSGLLETPMPGDRLGGRTHLRLLQVANAVWLSAKLTGQSAREPHSSQRLEQASNTILHIAAGNFIGGRLDLVRRLAHRDTATELGCPLQHVDVIAPVADRHHP